MITCVINHQGDSFTVNFTPQPLRAAQVLFSPMMS